VSEIAYAFDASAMQMVATTKPVMAALRIRLTPPHPRSDFFHVLVVISAGTRPRSKYRGQAARKHPASFVPTCENSRGYVRFDDCSLGIGIATIPAWA
jgi:hypothetical protein